MRWISEEELRKWIITKGCDEGCGYIDERDLNDMEWMEFEDGDKVKRQVYEQVMWERDVAIGQLKELGYEFGEKIESCEDCISRQAVLDLAKKGVLVSNGNYKSVCKAINELPSVNPQPCEDAISRQAVIDACDQSINLFEAVDRIKELPPVNPQKSTEEATKEFKELLESGYYEEDK